MNTEQPVNLTTGMAWVVVNDDDYEAPEVFGPFRTEMDAAVYAQGRFPSEDADMDGTTAWIVQVQFP